MSVIGEAGDTLKDIRARLGANSEYKAVTYVDLAAYQAGLATETAATWEPVDVARWTEMTQTVILVTYRRQL